MNVFKNFYESVKRGYNQEPNLGPKESLIIPKIRNKKSCRLILLSGVLFVDFLASLAVAKYGYYAPPPYPVKH